MGKITKSKLAKRLSCLKNLGEKYVWEETVHSISGIIIRLIAMRNEAWSQEISKKKNEKWGSIINYSFNPQDIDLSSCYVGYRKNDPKILLRKRQEIGICLLTENNGGRVISWLEIQGKNTKDDFDALKKYTPKQTAKLFSLSVCEANKKISKDMADAYKKYRKLRKD